MQQQIVIQKSKAVLEDLELGDSSVIQKRNGKDYVYTQVSGATLPMHDTTGNTIKQHIDKNVTTIIYGNGLPLSTLNPINGTNAMYVDMDTATSWVCTNATTDLNEWIPSSGGQLLGNAKDKAIMWTSQTTSENLVLPAGQNGLIVDSLTVEGDGSLEIQGNAVLVTV